MLQKIEMEKAKIRVIKDRIKNKLNGLGIVTSKADGTFDLIMDILKTAEEMEKILNEVTTWFQE